MGIRYTAHHSMSERVYRPDPHRDRVRLWLVLQGDGSALGELHVSSSNVNLVLMTVRTSAAW